MQKAEILNRSRVVPVAVVLKENGREDLSEYYLHGKQMPLHKFKKMCKKMPPIEVVVLKATELQ